MKYNQLGNTGMLVSELCLGTMTFSDGSGIYSHIGNTGQHDADAIVDHALQQGINFIDTADVYSAGASEITVGQSLRNLKIEREHVVIATKAYSRMGPGINQVGASRGHLMHAVDASLKRLQTDYIDLYQIHATDVLTPMDEILRALDDIISQGKVRYIGVSNWMAWRIASAMGLSQRKNYAPLATVQAYYSLAGRDLEREMIPMLEHHDMGLLVWSPLAGGLLSGKFNRTQQSAANARRSSFDFPVVDKERAWNVIDVLNEIAQKHQCSAARIALAWLLSRKAVTSVIIGAKRIDQLQDNIAACEIVLSETELAALDKVSALPPEYPGWMLATQGQDRFGQVDLWDNSTNHTS